MNFFQDISGNYSSLS